MCLFVLSCFAFRLSETTILTFNFPLVVFFTVFFLVLLFVFFVVFITVLRFLAKCFFISFSVSLFAFET